MRSTILCLAAIFCVVLFMGASTPPAPFEYAPNGQVKFPTDYRQWVFLSSGVGMTYGPLAAAGRPGVRDIAPPMFDNVFVNPDSYRAFLTTGRWPDKTMLILEVRTSESHASINKDGHFQTDIMGIEAEVKDKSAKTGEWTFYAFGDSKNPAPAGPIARNATCYTCHGANTAVENTFVQFYPVLYDIAERMGTLNRNFKAMPITPVKLLGLIEKEGWTSGAKALDSAAVSSPDAAVLDPSSLAMLSGHLLDAEHPSDAIALLQWTAQKHPQSAGLQNDLADAYLATGDKEAARAATKRALELATPDEREKLNQAASARLQKLQ
jgi:Cytochrome P460/Tetratricopeptide repeat